MDPRELCWVYSYSDWGGYNNPNILDMEEVGEEQVRANMNLIIDAGKTAQKCGLLPSELLNQRDDLRLALLDLWSWVQQIEDWSGVGDPPIERIEAAIKNTEQ